MRINKYIAAATGIGRRPADSAIAAGRVTVNGRQPSSGQDITSQDKVYLDGQLLSIAGETQLVMVNKPVGFVVSRNGQGSRTIYELLPDSLSHLKPVGRLDKDSSGLLLLTNDGQLANNLAHPSFSKDKVYDVELNKALTRPAQQQLVQGLKIEDYTSRLRLKALDSPPKIHWQVTLSQGRNRQIRKTFEALGYKVKSLHRRQVGEYHLGELNSGDYKLL